jgi:hypothetical protein
MAISTDALYLCGCLLGNSRLKSRCGNCAEAADERRFAKPEARATIEAWRDDYIIADPIRVSAQWAQIADQTLCKIRNPTEGDDGNHEFSPESKILTRPDLFISKNL